MSHLYPESLVSFRILNADRSLRDVFIIEI